MDYSESYNDDMNPLVRKLAECPRCRMIALLEMYLDEGVVWCPQCSSEIVMSESELAYEVELQREKVLNIA
jgi:ribosomal protein S27AE